MLSQSEYIPKVLEKFRMSYAKPVCIPLGAQFKLSGKDSSQTDIEREQMKVVPYATAIENLMYTMIYTIPNIAHTMGIVCRFMTNLGKIHWDAVKWIFRYLNGTKDKCQLFKNNALILFGFVDVDLVGSELDK